jgi:serine/threonine protein kinase
MNPEDDDRTIIRPPGGPRTGQIPASPAAGATAAYPPTQAMPPAQPATSMPTSAPTSSTQSVTTGGPNHALTLEPGTRLGEFEVTKTIGEGGFGIVYLAWDHSLDRKVALKEYMPTSLAYRAGATEIKPRSERHRETFEAGLKSFINEAKLLAQFDHPSLLKVYRFWEANGTAYMVMPFLEGATVRDTVRGMGAPPPESWILGLLAPLFDALAMLHASQIYHRDIAPDNVLLMADTGRPLLLDFGAARRVIGDMTQALTAILKPGYAPVEQYADMPGLKQGPWTDVYALAAVVHWMITSKTPPPSVGRLFDDPYVPLAQTPPAATATPSCARSTTAWRCMPEKRTPPIEAMRAELFGTPVPAAAPVTHAPLGGGAGTTCPARSRIRGPRRFATNRRGQTVPPTEQRMRTEVHPAARSPAGEQQDAARRRRRRRDRRRRAGRVRDVAQVASARPPTTTPTVAAPAVTTAPAASVATTGTSMPTRSSRHRRSMRRPSSRPRPRPLPRR